MDCFYPAFTLFQRCFYPASTLLLHCFLIFHSASTLFQHCFHTFHHASILFNPVSTLSTLLPSCYHSASTTYLPTMHLFPVFATLMHSAVSGAILRVQTESLNRQACVGLCRSKCNSNTHYPKRIHDCSILR